MNTQKRVIKIATDYIIGNTSQPIGASVSGYTELMTVTSDKDNLYITEIRIRYLSVALGAQTAITIELPDGATRLTSGTVMLDNIGQLSGQVTDSQGSINLKKPIKMSKGSYIKITAKTGLTAINAGDISISFHGYIKET